MDKMPCSFPAFAVCLSAQSYVHVEMPPCDVIVNIPVEAEMKQILDSSKTSFTSHVVFGTLGILMYSFQ